MPNGRLQAHLNQALGDHGATLDAKKETDTMTNKEKATGLMAQVLDRSRSDADRKADLAELAGIKKAAKTSWEKLGVSQAMYDREVAALAKREEMGLVCAEDFEMSEEELAAQAPRPKDEEPAHDTATLAAAVGDGPKAPKAKKEPKPKKEGDNRGLISEMIRELLTTTDEPYSAIVEAVCKKHSHATTTTRSVASVASDLRRAGKTVAIRRVPAKVKS